MCSYEGRQRRLSFGCLLVALAISKITCVSGVDSSSNGPKSSQDDGSSVGSKTSKTPSEQHSDPNATTTELFEEPCVDLLERCTYLAGFGECDANPGDMLSYCRKSCTACDSQTDHDNISLSDRAGDEEEPCVDDDDRCPRWEELGQCESSLGFMSLKCRRSCWRCVAEEQCEDRNERCSEWAERGDCEENPGYMLTNCRRSCETCVNGDVDFGEKQEVDRKSDTAASTSEIIRDSIKYMRRTKKDPTYARTHHLCLNSHALCSFWASIGECDENPSYMQSECGPACQSCDKFVFEERCPRNPNAVDSMHPGDLNKMFERITTSFEFGKYMPVVLSRPEVVGTSTLDTDNDSHQIEPWVVTFENFLSDEECDRLIALGYEQGYERSENVGEKLSDGSYGSEVDGGRTSTNAWCLDECYEDPVARGVMERIANVTGIPEANSEYLQLLRYEVGQFYEVHHDYILHHRERDCGVRTLTFFLYLNDVEEGGGTRFPDLNDLIVKPKKGKALLWPSVLDSDPSEKDEFTDHEAMAVKSGIKYGANAWVHLRDFKTPHAENCID